MSILKYDIRETTEFKNFYNWELNTNILHHKSENIERNLTIFKIYLGHSQCLHMWNMTKIGNKYNITRERVRQIYNKYTIHFILYLYYIMGYDKDNDLIQTLLGLLSRSRYVKSNTALYR